MIRLTLYVAGISSRSHAAIADLRQLCRQHLEGACETEIIDVAAQPQLAEKAKIMATPTLVKNSPLPSRRVIGDLADGEKVLLALDIHTDAASLTPGSR